MLQQIEVVLNPVTFILVIGLYFLLPQLHLLFSLTSLLWRSTFSDCTEHRLHDRHAIVYMYMFITVYGMPFKKTRQELLYICNNDKNVMLADCKSIFIL